MKKSLFILLLFIVGIANGTAQVKCYRFYLNNNSPDWRDTMVIACTSDPQVIADVQAQLALPVTQRNKHINGGIAAGNDNVNINANHSFLWHFKMDDWRLAEMSMEVCDGRPHSDVDQDTAYWLNTVQQFCPWGSYVRQEIQTAGVKDPGTSFALACYPNPATSHISIQANRAYHAQLAIVSSLGVIVKKQYISPHQNEIVRVDVKDLPAGIYQLVFTADKQVYTTKLSKLYW